MDSRDQHKETDALARRIAQRWQPTPAVTSIAQTVRRIQRTVSRAGVIRPRVDRLPVVSMERYASRHLARFPETTTHFEPRAMTLPAAPRLPLVGEPVTKPAAAAPPTPIEPSTGGEFTSTDEEPEWLKRLPSFEEAASRLKFPDSVDVKLPEPTRQDEQTQTQARAAKAPQPPEPRAAEPPGIARKPEAPEPPEGPRRMRVMTQVEEFTPGRQPPPVSLQDLRRVRVGEPRPSEPKAEVQRTPPEPPADTTPPHTSVPEDDEAPPIVESEPPSFQRTLTEPEAPEPPVQPMEEGPDVGPPALEMGVKPAPAEGEAPMVQRAPTEASPEPPAPTAAREIRETEDARTPPTDAPARRPPISRADEPLAIQRAPTDAVEPTPVIPPDMRKTAAREETEAPSVQDAAPESEEPPLFPDQPPTEASSAVEGERVAPEPPERTTAQEAQIDEGEDTPQRGDGEPAALQRAAAEATAPEAPERPAPPSSLQAPVLKGDAGAPTVADEPPSLHRTPAEPSAPESPEPFADSAPRPATPERAPEKPRRGPVETSATAEKIQNGAEGAGPPALQRTPADATESEPPEPPSPLQAPVLGGDDAPPSEELPLSAETEPPAIQRAPAEPATEARDEEPEPTSEDEAPLADASEPAVLQRAAAAALESAAPSADTAAPQPRVTEDDEEQPTVEREPPSMQRQPSGAAAPEPSALPAVEQGQRAAPTEEAAWAPVEAESEPPAIQRAPADGPTPESPPPSADTSAMPPPILAPEEDAEPGGTVETPVIAEEGVMARGQKHRPEAKSQGPAPAQERAAPTGLENLTVDAGLVQRLSARAAVAVQREPASTRAEAPFVQLSSPPETLLGAQPERVTVEPGPETPAPSPLQTPPARPSPGAVTRTLPRDADAPPRTPAPLDLPLAPRPAVVQRTALRPETETGISPEPVEAPAVTLDARPPLTMTTVLPSTAVQRTPPAEPVTEARTLEAMPEPLPEEPLDLLTDGDLIQLAREVLPVVKRLLRVELERRPQPDLDW